MKAPVAFALACLVAIPAAAQDERVRLDEFWIAHTSSAVAEVDQVAPGAVSIDGSEQPADRQVSVSQPPVPRRADPVAQLSTAGEVTRPQQLGAGERPSAEILSVSSRGESRPQAVQRLAGDDRCDPQLPGAQLDRCRSILERRATEFSAPEAPQLSSEQRLMAERDRLDAEAAARNGDLRVRYAAIGQPDADLRSNQELAALVLEAPSPPERPSAPEQNTDSLAEALRGLSIQTQSQGAPAPN